MLSLRGYGLQESVDRPPGLKKIRPCQHYCKTNAKLPFIDGMHSTQRIRAVTSILVVVAEDMLG